MVMQTKKDLKNIKNRIKETNERGFILEKDINFFKNKLANNKMSLNDFNGEDDSTTLEPGIIISEEQTEKGLKWLLDKMVTPNGKKRKNNPFTIKQEGILNNFSYFTLQTFITVNATPFVRCTYPVYRVVSKSGDGFDYYYNGYDIVKPYNF